MMFSVDPLRRSPGVRRSRKAQDETDRADLTQDTEASLLPVPVGPARTIASGAARVAGASAIDAQVRVNGAACAPATISTARRPQLQPHRMVQGPTTGVRPRAAPRAPRSSARAAGPTPPPAPPPAVPGPRSAPPCRAAPEPASRRPRGRPFRRRHTQQLGKHRHFGRPQFPLILEHQRQVLGG